MMIYGGVRLVTSLGKLVANWKSSHQKLKDLVSREQGLDDDQLKIVKKIDDQVEEVVQRLDDVERAVQRAKNWEYLNISERHMLNKLGIPKKAGNTMFLISKKEIYKDLEEIRKLGDKIRKGDKFYTSSGRIYGIDEKSIHPISGSPGTIDITSAEYNILKFAKKNGDEAAIKQLNMMYKKGLFNIIEVERVKKLLKITKEIK